MSGFADLTPDRAIDLTERAIGKRCTNLSRSLPSYINRVYDLECEDNSWVVTKFFRPGRWSTEALQDEQDFVAACAAAEIPVVAALVGVDGKRLHQEGDLRFAVYPKRGGRPLDEPNDQQWSELGRLLGRVHDVGAKARPRDRIRLHPRHSSESHLEEILQTNFESPSLRRSFEETARRLLDDIAPMFEDVATLRIHGDLHAQNLIQRPGEPLHLIDFDDMAVGPAVQDMWMLLPGRSKDCRRELDLLLDGYYTFREFDPRELHLIEPLRAMRFIHFTAWCARQQRDGGFARQAPGWGSNAFWKTEIADLERQHQEIVDSPE